MGCTLTTGWGGTFKKNVEKKKKPSREQGRIEHRGKRGLNYTPPPFTCPCYNFAGRSAGWERKWEWERDVLLGHFHSTPYLHLSFAGGKVGWQGNTKWAKTPFRNPVSGRHGASISPCSAFKPHNCAMSLKIWAEETGRCPLMLCHQTHTQLRSTNKCQKLQTVMTWAVQKNAEQPPNEKEQGLDGH